MGEFGDGLLAKAESKRKQDQDRGPSPGKSPRQFLMAKKQLGWSWGERQVLPAGQVGENRSTHLNGAESEKQQPRLPWEKLSSHQIQKQKMGRWKKYGQSEGNMNRSTVLESEHLRMKLPLGLPWRQLALIFVLLFMIPGARATEDDRGRTKALMHGFVLEFAKMSPYLASDKEFTSEKGKAVIADSLNSISSKIKAPTPLIKDNSGFRITYELLSDHILKTKQAFDSGEMEYARMRVNGIGNLCSACHMQAPKIAKFSAFEFVVGKNENVNFENADFLFVIRRYDEALAQYDKLAREFPKGSLTSDRLPEVYRRKLAIFARVYRDPVGAVANLSEDLKNKSLPVDVRRNIETWIESLNKWKREKTNPEDMPTEELLAFVAGSLPKDPGRKIAPSHPELLSLLRLSGLLYERLYKEPNGPLTPQILFYLASCERSLSPLYWYPLSEIYLKECIVKFPANPFAKKCYDSYRTGMQERYFGKPLPEGVKQTLDAFKKYL